MSICWYCHWGWPKPVADIFLAAKEALGGDDDPLLYGPSHIVWEDENWHLAQTCIDYINQGKYCDNHSAEQLAIVRWSLERLAELPAEARDVEPEDYDGEHPENYPPSVEMVRI